jgi:NAD(P)-dependent dehydrogenase (short-subunit alcohol dehydrogenase family)
MAGPLAGKVAVIAGASRTIGQGSAVELAAAGAFVYALGRTVSPGTGEGKGSLAETMDQIREVGGEGEAIACDCTDDAALAAMIARVQAEKGRLDVLVNSVFSAPKLSPWIGKKFWETPAEHWHDIVDVGAGSAYLTSRRAAPLLIETAKREGKPTLIVNVSGRAAFVYRYNVVYGAGKAATERLTRDMALDLKDQAVAVVSIWPNGAAIEPPETSRYSGRAAAGLAADPNVMAISGKHYWSADLGQTYGFTDEFGHTHTAPEMVDYFGPDGRAV